MTIQFTKFQPQPIKNMTIISNIGDLSNDYARLRVIRDELLAINKRESNRHMMDSHLPVGGENLLDEIIEMLESFLEYEPTDDELTGEPPMSAAERLNEAWSHHLQMHG